MRAVRTWLTLGLVLGTLSANSQEAAIPLTDTPQAHVLANPRPSAPPPAPVAWHEPIPEAAPVPDTTNAQGSNVVNHLPAPGNEEEAYRQTPLGAFDAARAGEFGRCTVVQFRRVSIRGGIRVDRSGCTWRVKVGERIYPESDGSVCSGASAGRVNCNIGTQEENAGCLLLRAARAGYCQ